MSIHQSPHDRSHCVEWRLSQARGPHDVAELLETLLSFDTFLDRVGQYHYALPRKSNHHLMGVFADPHVSVMPNEAGSRLRVDANTKSAVVNLPDGTVVSGKLDKRDLERVKILTRNQELMLRAIGTFEQSPAY